MGGRLHLSQDIESLDVESGQFFSSGKDTWHGLEKKNFKKERRCIQINYVTFKTDWPVAAKI